MKLQEFFKTASGKGVSRKIQESLKEVLQLFQGKFIGVLRVFQGFQCRILFYKKKLGHLQKIEIYSLRYDTNMAISSSEDKGVSKKYEGYFKSVSKVCQRNFMGVLEKFIFFQECLKDMLSKL